MRKWLVVLIFLFIFLAFDMSSVTGNENQLIFNHLFEIKNYTEEEYIIITDKNLYFYDLNHQLIKTLQYNYLGNKVKVEVVSDLDHKGFNDILIINIDNISNQFSNASIISYETNEVIYEVKTKMKNIGNLDMNVAVTDYFIDENYLYISYGYLLDKLNLETLEVEQRYLNSNNIYSIETITDLNGDYKNEIALTSQGGALIFLDGFSFKKMDVMNIAKELVLLNGVIIKRNLFDLLYDEQMNRLIIASEDGFIYELALETKELKQIQLNSTDNIFFKSYYSEFLKQFGNEGNLSNNKSILYKKIELVKVIHDEFDYYISYSNFNSLEDVKMNKKLYCSNSLECYQNDTIVKFSEHYLVNHHNDLLEVLQKEDNRVLLSVELTKERVMSKKLRDVFLFNQTIYLLFDNNIEIYHGDQFVKMISYSKTNNVEVSKILDEGKIKIDKKNNQVLIKIRNIPNIEYTEVIIDDQHYTYTTDSLQLFLYENKNEINLKIHTLDDIVYTYSTTVYVNNSVNYGLIFISILLLTSFSFGFHYLYKQFYQLRNKSS